MRGGALRSAGLEQEFGMFQARGAYVLDGDGSAHLRW